MNRAAVIGGGVSGIAAAQVLAARGHAVDIYEAAMALGGRVASVRRDGRWIDLGGKNIGRRYPRFRAFAESLGADWEPFGLNTSTVLRGRRIGLAREGPPLRNLHALLRLCGVPGLARLVAPALAVRRDPRQGFLQAPYFARLAGPADRPLSGVFGRRCTEGLIRPLTVRTNGAEPEEAWLGNFGSNLGVLLDSFDQPAQGMGGLFERFAAAAPAARIRLLLGHRVAGLTPRPGAPGGSLDWVSDTERGSAEYGRVVVALPAHAAAALLAPQLPGLGAALRGVVYHPVAVAVARYARPVFRPECRALVLPRDSPLSNAGAYGVRDLDLVRWTFSGAAARPLLAQGPEGETLVGLAERIAASRSGPGWDPGLDLAGNRRLWWAYRNLPQGLCGYSRCHGERLALIRRTLASWPGLALCGDYWRGASIEACFRAAEEAVADG